MVFSPEHYNTLCGNHLYMARSGEYTCISAKRLHEYVHLSPPIAAYMRQ